jgi:Glycosyltransferase family 87
MVAAFLAYLVAVLLLSGGSPARVGAVLGFAVAIQLVPLLAPVLLSTDVYTYWDYGRLSAIHGENPYVVEPLSHPGDPAFARMGEDWRNTTSVYGPAFTLSSEGHALVVGESATAASWLYKGIAGLALVLIAWLAARVAARPALAAAFVGWNPLLAVHFAGGGHNDAWMMGLVVGAIALAAAGRRQAAGAAWAAAIAVKWVAIVFLPLRALEARRRGRRVGHWGFAVVAVLVVLVATWRYGTAWLDAFGPVSRNLREGARYSLPSRLESLGVSHDVAAGIFIGLFALAYLWLLREAWRGRARLGLAAGLLVAAAPWLVPWYAVWAVPLAAIEEDRAARLLALALTAYLLRDAVPL